MCILLQFFFNSLIKNGLFNVVLLFFFCIAWIGSLFFFGLLDRAYGAYQFISIVSLGNYDFFFLFIGMAIDGLSLSFLLLTSLIFFLCILTTFDNNIIYLKEYCYMIAFIFIFFMLGQMHIALWSTILFGDWWIKTTDPKAMLSQYYSEIDAICGFNIHDLPCLENKLKPHWPGNHPIWGARYACIASFMFHLNSLTSF